MNDRKYYKNKVTNVIGYIVPTDINKIFHAIGYITTFNINNFNPATKEEIKRYKKREDNYKKNKNKNKNKY